MKMQPKLSLVKKNYQSTTIVKFHLEKLMFFRIEGKRKIKSFTPCLECVN